MVGYVPREIHERFKGILSGHPSHSWIFYTVPKVYKETKYTISEEQKNYSLYRNDRGGMSLRNCMRDSKLSDESVAFIVP